MRVQRAYLSAILSFLFLSASTANAQSEVVHSLSFFNPLQVQIAQSDEKKPVSNDGEDDLGEDDC